MTEDGNDESYETRDNERGYWRANLRLMGICLVIWFTVSRLGCCTEWMEKKSKKYGANG